MIELKLLLLTLLLWFGEFGWIVDCFSYGSLGHRGKKEVNHLLSSASTLSLNPRNPSSISTILDRLTKPFFEARSQLFQASSVNDDYYDEENRRKPFSSSSSSASSYSDEDYEFQENYRRVYNYTFDRSQNPNISLTVSFTIDKLAAIVSNPSYLQKYSLPGIFSLLDETAQPIYVNYSENMIPLVLQKLKEVQALKKIAASQLNQIRKLSFSNNADEEVYRKVQNLQISAVKMEILPKAKLSMIEKVTISLIKRMKPVMNLLLVQNEADIKALMMTAQHSQSQSQSLPSLSPSYAPTASPTVSPLPKEEKVSPFQGTNNNNEEDDGDEDEESPWLEMNKENVDKVLNQVRPYLIADGGNVEVVNVNAKEGTIELFLEGACGSCSSSATTMKMGIERVLRENFRNLLSVIALNQKPKELTVEVIQELLSKLTPTIEKLGGKIAVESVDAATGMIKMKYSGPDRLRKGIDVILRENKQVKAVEYV